MLHARHRSPVRRPRPRAALPAVLLSVAAVAFAGLAVVPATAGPAPDVLAFADTAQSVPLERSFDMARASRTRELHPTPKPAAAKPQAAVKPKPVAKPTATPTKAASRLRRTTKARLFGGRCPVPSASFTDTWGAPRPGGRRHKGTDMMASTGDPVYAVADGVVDTDYSSNGGISLYLRTANGDRFFYAHNSRNLASDGERVQAGELIARVGSTGNASGGASHVHFEREVNGVSVNPYPFVRSIC